MVLRADGPHCPSSPLHVPDTAAFCLFMECSRNARMLQDTKIPGHFSLIYNVGKSRGFSYRWISDMESPLVVCRIKQPNSWKKNHQGGRSIDSLNTCLFNTYYVSDSALEVHDNKQPTISLIPVEHEREQTIQMQLSTQGNFRSWCGLWRTAGAPEEEDPGWRREDWVSFWRSR